MDGLTVRKIYIKVFNMSLKIVFDDLMWECFYKSRGAHYLMQHS